MHQQHNNSLLYSNDACIARVWARLPVQLHMCLFPIYDLYLPWQQHHVHVLACTVVFFCTHVHPTSANWSLCLSAFLFMCVSLRLRVRLCLYIACTAVRASSVSVGSCWKQTGRVRCVPSWHAPWDNERLCLGLDCWLRIIQQHKQATVPPYVHTWNILCSESQRQVWS